MPKKERYTIEQVSEALRASAGLRSVAARKLGCHPTTVTTYIERHPELQKAEAECVESTLDLAEAKLFELINGLKVVDRAGELSYRKDPNLGAICFYLKCKGKSRGYIEKWSDVSNDGEVVIRVVREDVGDMHQESPPKTKRVH